MLDRGSLSPPTYIFVSSSQRQASTTDNPSQHLTPVKTRYNPDRMPRGAGRARGPRPLRFVVELQINPISGAKALINQAEYRHWKRTMQQTEKSDSSNKRRQKEL
ncbi:hypothetical protein Nepgr_007729 [Nepenthes gracilis]|uniref:Uncharacterized protein n=1 Tax=Nepenthes gracilis TaxID=150966 RepID=A0AAD3S7U0_NEPGR|nr:hypothetical protein Nepgr_007729 [Nepenthes gracilis]